MVNRRHAFRAWLVKFLTCWLPLLTGLLVALPPAVWFSLDGGDLGVPMMTRYTMIVKTTAPNNVWVTMTLLMALGFALLAGPRRWVSWADPAAIFGVLWVGFWLLVGGGAHDIGEFVEPEDQCVREGCWPGNWLVLGFCTPAIIACLVTLLMATVGRNAPRWVRAVVPAVVFIVLTITQLLVWDTHAIPFFSGPRPW